jgi:hypothetical protein
MTIHLTVKVQFVDRHGSISFSTLRVQSLLKVPAAVEKYIEVAICHWLAKH